ncbi:DUF3192 domain-containing protein [Rheinheimera sp. UJ51]|uniref:DUF3192 domain-containing protein n=1 Tax=unclassified Rheinheimera TaxID=115860 RepID=UPI001E2AB97F|nr:MULTISPECIES: DUF3192 domain-containing protein [unclassified Rheinheimera]MCC5451551.1 DUF3192 domain-containing protein [Rheinheimera sp. UJ51]MCF4008109.1 DUF3192 domain-containing protein [Rheinheimera sp. UJ63]
MKFKTLLWFAAGVVLYFVSTFAILRFYPDDPTQMNWQDRESFNAKVIQRLDLKQPLAQDALINRLGSPDITEAFVHNNQVYQLLYYRTHRKAADGITTADECTALLFINRQLTAIGDDATKHYLEQQPHAGSID